MFRARIGLLWLLGAGFFVSSSFSGFAFALEYDGVGGQPAYFRSDVPKSKHIFLHTLSPGQVQEEGIIVHNLDSSGSDKVILIHGVDTVHSSGGGVACAQVLDTQDEVGSWIAFETNEVIIPALGKEKVPFTITVPEGVSAGEYNGCVVIQEKKDVQGSGLSLSTRVGLRVAITVPGVLHREIVAPSVVMHTQDDGDFSFQVSGTNTGNVSVTTEVSLKTRSLATGLLVSEQGGGYPIYRGKTQRWNFVLEKPFWGGPYLVTTQISYGSSDDSVYDVVLKASNIFLFVLPAPLAIGIEVGVLFLIIISLILLRRRRRARRARSRGAARTTKVGRGE